MTLLSEIYDVTLKRVGRNEAKNGYIRPTMGQSYMTHKDWDKTIKSIPLASQHYKSSDTVDTRCSTGSVPHSEGKYYFEVAVKLQNYRTVVLYGKYKFGLLPEGELPPYTRDALVHYGQAYTWNIPINISSYSSFTRNYQCYVDLTAGTMDIYYNGSLTYTISGIVGNVYPYFGVSSTSNATGREVFHSADLYINFGADEFMYPDIANRRYWGN